MGSKPNPRRGMVIVAGSRRFYKMTSLTMLDRFQGCLLGGLVGDCLGAEFEFRRGQSVLPRQQVAAHVAAVKAGKRAGVVGPGGLVQEEYTDDTAMARQIALSFVEQKKLDIGCIARRFTEEYFDQPGRGYGAAVREVFEKLRDQQYKDPLRPAAEQFGGSGSYGNGAGMRAHPIGMALMEATEKEVVEVAQIIARVTHSHSLGVMGGVMQAVGVYHALRGATPAEVRERVEATVEDDIDFSMKMGVIHRSLQRSEEEDLDYIVRGGDEAVGLGNGVAALHSVPTALFCFLMVLGKEDTEKERSIEASQALFEEVLVLAIRCGGDTDTIASMACALAGAALGQQAVAPKLVARGEAGEDMKNLAASMWEVINGGQDGSQVKKPRL